MANSDIQLLFSVLGGGSLSGESGSLIQSELTQILNELNKNPLKIKVALDAESTKKTSWTAQLQKKLDALNTGNKLSVTVSNIKIGTNAISSFKQQLGAVINTLNLDKDVSVSFTAKDIGEITTQFKSAGDAAAEAAHKAAEFKVQMEMLGNLKSSVQKSLAALTTGNESEEEKARITELTAQYEQWAVKVEEVRASKQSTSGEYKAALEAEGAAIQDNINKMQQERQAAAEAKAAQTAAAEGRQAAEDAAERAAEKARADEARAYGAATERNNLYKQIADTITRIKKAQQDWNAAESGKSRNEYANLSNYIDQLQALQNRFSSLSKTEIREELSAINSAFAKSSSIIKATGENTKTLTSRVGNLAGKFTSWLTISQVIMKLYQAIKQMVSAVIEVDTAMTELRKVTDETEATYSKFLDTAITRSKQLGATVADTVTASADFARLGYTIDEAAQLADAAIIYKNVGDGIEDISEASESIISTMKAFGVEAENAMTIVDKFNEVGNNFAISSEGVGEALRRSASALAAGNNTLDESIALITAANSVVQDADVVGTTMKTVSMYLRAAKTEAEEAGESTEGMANSVSELRDELLTLTNGKVDIQLDDTTFKSTYQIMKELAAVWGELTDITQANILEQIGGKRNANVVSSLLENFSVAEDVVKTAAESAGSALKENEKYLDSIEGKISEFKATFQELAVTLIDSDFVKQVVELGTGLLNVLNAVAKVIDAVGGLNTVLGITAGLLISINRAKIAASLASLVAPIKNLITLISDIRASGITTGKAITTMFAQATASATGFQAALGWIGIAIAVVPLVVKGIQSLIVTQEEAYEAAEDLRAEYEDTQSELESLNEEFDTTQERIEELKRLSRNGTITLVEQAELDRLIETNEQLATTIAREKELAAIRASESNDGYVKAYNKESFSSLAQDNLILEQERIYAEYGDLIDRYREYQNYPDASINPITDEEIEKAAELENRLFEINNILQSGVYHDDNGNVHWTDESVKYDEHIEQLVAQYEYLNGLKSQGVELTQNEQATLDSAKRELLELAEELQSDYIDNYVGDDDQISAWKELIDLINKTVVPEAFFTEKLTQLPDELVSQMTTLGKDAELTTEQVETLAKQFPELQAWMAESGYTAEDVAKHYNALAAAEEEAAGSTEKYTATLSVLPDTLAALQTAYDLVTEAEEEMVSGDGLSVDTIQALADAEENYLDYLYEENGVVKLNTEAWKERSNAQIQSDISEIENTIRLIERQNTELEESIAYYKEQREIGNDGNIWTNMITDATAEIEENNKAIAENQSLLALYSSLYSSITGEADAYTTSLNNFAKVSNTIDAVSNSFQTLANLQAQVADGFTMPLDKALEFAAVYPEILNNATVAADGQLMLNEGVVNAFIAGKKAELDAQIDSQIMQLEADKAVLEGKLASAQAQLELAKSVGEGEGQISKEVAEYRINTGNALTAALIDMGVEESQAYALAAAAMSEDEEEFARVAKECFENLDENSAKAAYNMAHAIFVNADNSCTSIADIAAQAHETAKAIAAMGDGDIAGSSGSVFGGGDGNLTSGLSLDLYDGTFNGSDYEYEGKTIDLDDYISQIELDISAYENAISQIDGQIAALEALKNAPLKSFTSDTSGGSGSGNKDEVEEYLADIDEYYEALKRLESIQERLSKLQAQIEYADTEEEKIALTKQLINVYDDEADALENLNKLRSETITNGKAELEALGFQVSYDASTNEFMVHNMEHLNELYGATQEETNELRKSTEELIDTMESLNSSNQEGASSLRTLKADIKSAKQAIVDYLKEIVTASSDVVDEYQNVYDTLHSAADEYAASGFITIDTLQSIIELGAQYMQYLMDENGLLVINEENINKVLAAKTQELALNQAMIYVERLRLALQENSIEDLNNLLYATTEATNATWGLVYANLALLGLDDDQYQAALHNINAIRSLADSAISGIGQVSGQTTEELNSMKDGLDDILQYVMDMLKQRINDQIDALEDMKDAYADIIALRKEALESAKEEADYQDEVAEKVKEIAKLQARINALSLDDSRDAQAQKAQLEEEMAELQKELADTQADYALDAQKDALDDMQDAYEKQKDAEIEVLEDSISSYQKLYDMAISYIENNWDSLYSDLIAWNYEYGSELDSTITTAWDNALAAAQRYGSYVSALNSIDADISSASGSSTNYTVGNTTYDSSSSNEEMIHAIIKEMYANSQAHHTASTEEKARLNKRNLTLGTMLAQYGVNAYRDNTGTWYVDSGELLYEKYKKYIYHTGGIAGDQPTLKQNEILAVLEKGEAVLDERREKGLFRLVDFVTELSDRFGKLISNVGYGQVFPVQGIATADDLSAITSNKQTSVHFGDVYIYGTAEETAEKHREINREFTNEVLKQLNIKR